MSLGMVREIGVENNKVFLHLEDSGDSPSLQEKIREAVTLELGAIGADRVELCFSSKEKNEKRKLSGSPIPGVRHVIAVASGKGGVGKSTVAVNLAFALGRQGTRVGLMDGDIYGPNIPIMLGISSQVKPQTNESGKIIPLEAQGVKAVSIGFFANPEQPIIWRGPLLHKTVEQFLHQVDWGELDYLVVDLPPGTGDVQLSLAQWVPLSGAVIVVTPQEVALADARRAVSMFRQLEISILGIIENMTGPVFGKGGGEKMAEVLQIPFLGEVPLEAQVRECGDAGVPVVRAHPKSPISERFFHIADGIRKILK